MSAISSFPDSYVQEFPNQVPLKMAQSFVASSAIHLLFGASVNVMLIGGAVAALATVVEAIARPVLKTIFPEHSWVSSNVSIFAGYSVSIFAAYSVARFAAKNAVAQWLRTADTTGVFGMVLLSDILFNDEYFEKNEGFMFIM